MASGTIDLGVSNTSGSFIRGKIDWSSTFSTSSNTSNVTVKLYVKKGNTNMTLTIPTEGTWYYELTVDGQTVKDAISKSVLEEWVLLRTYTVSNIAHSLTGVKSISISGQIIAPEETSFKGHKVSKSNVNITLDAIPRPTKIISLTCSSSYVDGTLKAVYQPNSTNAYTQRVVYVLGGGTWVRIHTEKFGQAQSVVSKENTIKFDANQLSTIYATVTSNYATIRVAFQTYSDSGYANKIGDEVLDITLLLPDSVAPTAKLTITQVNSSSWLASKGLYVAGLSGAIVELSATAGDGATPTSTIITYNGTSYDATTPKTFAINKSGNIEFIGKITNSRNQTATDSKTITVLPYSPPAITSIWTERGTYNSGWTADENGQDIRVVFKTTLALTDKGNVYNVTFKINGASKTPNQGATTGLSSGVEREVYFLGLSGDLSHALALTATDSTDSTGSATLTIPTAHVTIEFRANGKGIAFGKASEKDAFECAWNAEFGGNVSIKGSPLTDFVVEQGASGIWIYRKWNSGIAECWGVSDAITQTTSTDWNIMTSNTSTPAVSYPFTFKNSPVVSPSVHIHNANFWLVTMTAGSTTETPTYQIARGKSATTVTFKLGYYVFGQWK